MDSFNTGNVEASEVLRAQAHVMNHQYSFIRSMSIEYAAQLGITDAIYKHGEPMNLQDLAASLSIRPKKIQFLQRLMRILTHSGFFSEQEISHDDHQNGKQTKGYVLTTASQLLLKDNPFSVVPDIFSMHDPNMMKPWHCLTNWLTNGDDNEPTPFYAAHGATMWDYASKAPELNTKFNDRMTKDSRLVASLLVGDERFKGKFEGLDTLVDVAGGTGEMAKALSVAYPDLKCVVLDLPHVVDGLKGTNNLSYVAGNMFEAIPSADAVLLKWILHDWSDEECVKILKACRKAITCNGRRGGGKVIIIDIVMDDSNDQLVRETQLFYDMIMMTLLTGRERNENEWRNLFIDAGFNNYEITPLPGYRSLIEIYP